MPFPYPLPIGKVVHEYNTDLWVGPLFTATPTLAIGQSRIALQNPGKPYGKANLDAPPEITFGLPGGTSVRQRFLLRSS